MLISFVICVRIKFVLIVFRSVFSGVYYIRNNCPVYVVQTEIVFQYSGRFAVLFCIKLLCFVSIIVLDFDYIYNLNSLFLKIYWYLYIICIFYLSFVNIYTIYNYVDIAVSKIYTHQTYNINFLFDHPMSFLLCVTDNFLSQLISIYVSNFHIFTSQCSTIVIIFFRSHW